jgi:hypothetical protein
LLAQPVRRTPIMTPYRGAWVIPSQRIIRFIHPSAWKEYSANFALTEF